MKKSLKVLLVLTFLSGCNTMQSLEFWKSDPERVSGARHTPALNSGVASDSSMAAPPMMPPMTQGGLASPPEPPSFGKDDFMSNPGLAQPQPIPNPMATASASGRRAPEFNRNMLGNAPSGDLVSAAPAPMVSQSRLAAPTAQAQTILPQGDLQVPPPPPMMAEAAKPSNAYPRLAEIPPAPAVPKPAAEDARIAQMKQDLADMQQQQGTFQSSGNSIAIRGGAGASSQVQEQTPRRPGDGGNRPALIASSPADPYLANAQTAQLSAPKTAMAQPMMQPPTPPMMQPQQAPMPPQMMAPQPQTINQASVMPQGPTVVVHSKNGSARPYNPQMAMYSPPPAPMAVPTTPVMSAPIAPLAQPTAPVPSMGTPAFKRSQATARPPAYLDNNMAQSQGTSLSALHPIPVEPAQSYASSNDSPANSYGDSQGLQPIPTNNIHMLPSSRYSTMRSDSRDSSGY